MDPYGSEDGPCTLCSAPGRACAGCYLVFYCGKEHQLSHWQQGHKTACAPYKVSKDPALGRFLEATRDINAGTFIMKSKPFVYGPQITWAWKTNRKALVCSVIKTGRIQQVVFLTQMSSEPVCLGCCRRLENEPDDWYQCTSCGWPLCSVKCQESEQHKPECTAMVKADFFMGRDCGKVTILGGLEEINQWCWYGSIIPIRVLLLAQKDYKKFMTLQTHIQEHRRNPEFNFKVRSVTGFIHNTLKLKDFKEEDIATILAIFDTNAFEVSQPDLNQMGRALYYMGSMMAHACKPNARLCHVGESFEMALMAEESIPCGGSITISYMDRLNGTLKRLTHLRTTKHFDCCCSRCSDPTDLGLFLDSLRCTKCRDGGKMNLLVSTEPSKLTADWLCQDVLCGHRISASEMLHFHKDLRTAKMNLDDSSQLSDYEKFFNKHLGPNGLLHPTSSYILQIKVFLIFNILGHSSGYFLTDLNKDLLNYKLLLCKEMLEIAKVLHPGYSRTRAFLLMELQETLMEQIKRNLKNKSTTEEAAQESIKEVKALLDESASILREPARRADVEAKLTQFHQKCKNLGIKVR